MGINNRAAHNKDTQIGFTLGSFIGDTSFIKMLSPGIYFTTIIRSGVLALRPITFLSRVEFPEAEIVF
jgi:hypothetical protein